MCVESSVCLYIFKYCFYSFPEMHSRRRGHFHKKPEINSEAAINLNILKDEFFDVCLTSHNYDRCTYGAYEF